jgi:hypothetical protein
MGGEVGNCFITSCQEKVHDTDGKSEAEDRSQKAGGAMSPSGYGQYPPGVDNRRLEFNAQAVFSPDVRVEMGGGEFNRQELNVVLESNSSRDGAFSPSTEEGGGEKVRGGEVVKSDWRGVYDK